MLLLILGNGVVANVVLNKTKGQGSTGYAINPARDLGPRLAHAVLPIPGKGGSDWGYAGVPVAGPIIGGLIAAFLYRALWPA